MSPTLWLVFRVVRLLTRWFLPVSTMTSIVSSEILPQLAVTPPVEHRPANRSSHQKSQPSVTDLYAYKGPYHDAQGLYMIDVSQYPTWWQPSLHHSCAVSVITILPVNVSNARWQYLSETLFSRHFLYNMTDSKVSVQMALMTVYQPETVSYTFPVQTTCTS